MRRKHGRRSLPLTVAAVLLAALAFYLYSGGEERVYPESDLELHFIDVGQGDAAMLITDEATVVIDCGPTSSADVLCEYIKERCDKIDCLVISHPHEDHMGGASVLIEEFEIGEIIMEGYDEFENDAPVFYERAYDAMVEHELYPVLAVPGEVHTYGDITLEILAPLEDNGDRNNNSIVLRAEVDGVSAIFTGDAETKAEEELLETFYESLDADVLKIGHHGSSTSTSEAFLTAVSPDVAVISCGDGNSYGHPHGETLQLLRKYSIDYYRTDENGSVVLVCRDGELCLK